MNDTQLLLGIMEAIKLRAGADSRKLLHAVTARKRLRAGARPENITVNSISSVARETHRGLFAMKGSHQDVWLPEFSFTWLLPHAHVCRAAETPRLMSLSWPHNEEFVYRKSLKVFPVPMKSHMACI